MEDPVNGLHVIFIGTQMDAERWDDHAGPPGLVTATDNQVNIILSAPLAPGMPVCFTVWSESESIATHAALWSSDFKCGETGEAEPATGQGDVITRRRMIGRVGDRRAASSNPALPNADAAGPDKSIGAGCFSLRLLPGGLLQSAHPLPAGVLSSLVQQPRGETAAPVGLREEAHYRPDRLIVYRCQNARIRESTVGLAWREERTTRPAGRSRTPAGRAAG